MRKTTYLLTVMLVLSLNRIHAQAPYTLNSNQTLNSGTYTWTAYDINSADRFSQSVNATDIASDNVHLTDGYKTNSLNGGSYHAYIDPNAPPDVVSFHPNGFTGIPKYDRFELGLKVPTAIQQKITDFLSNAYSGSHLSTDLNPYDPDKVKVKVDYTLGTNTYTRYGFYYRDFSENTTSQLNYSNSNPQSLNSPWTETSTLYTFRMRFAPPATGAWSFTVSLIINGVVNQVYSGNFTVVNSNNPGPLVFDDHLMKMKFSDNNQAFFGIGQDIFGAAQNKWAVVPADPFTYTLQRGYISDLALHHGNFARIALSPWSNQVETMEGFPGKVYANDPSPKPLSECLTNYDHNQRHMMEFDKTLELCESDGIYVMLCLLNNPYFSPANGDGMPTTWSNNPYSTFPGTANGYLLCGASPGNGDNLYDFFALNSTMNVYKKTLFYINARWGYSPSIAMWEHINETDNLYAYNDPNNPGNLLEGFNTCGTTPGNFRSRVLDWVCSMENYMDGFYPQHIQTNGYGSFPLNDLSTNVPGNPQIPVGCANYEVSSANNYTLCDVFNTGRNASTKNVYWNAGQSWIFGEVGGGVCAAGCGQRGDGCNSPTDCYSDRDFHNTIWSGAFSGSVAVPQYFWDYEEGNSWQACVGNPISHRSNFDALNSFLTNHVDFNQGKLFPNMVTDGPVWDAVDNYYLSNVQSNALEAYGWCQNRHYWSGNDPQEITVPNYSCTYSAAINAGQTGLLDDLGNSSFPYYVKFNNLLPNWIFNLDYYETVNGTYQGTIPGTSDASGNLSFLLPLYHDRLGNGQYPDYAYVLSSSNANRLDNSQANIIKSGVNVYPNPATTNIFISNNTGNEIQSCRVYNLVGEEQSCKLTPGNFIDISNLVEGAYFVHVIIADYDNVFKIVKVK